MKMKNKKILIISLILNIVLLMAFVSLFNNKISWEHNGKIYTHKAGDFWLERLRGE